MIATIIYLLVQNFKNKLIKNLHPTPDHDLKREKHQKTATLFFDPGWRRVKLTFPPFYHHFPPFRSADPDTWTFGLEKQLMAFGNGSFYEKSHRINIVASGFDEDARNYFDVRLNLLHEVGHAFGLSHTTG